MSGFVGTVPVETSLFLSAHFCDYLFIIVYITVFYYLVFYYCYFIYYYYYLLLYILTLTYSMAPPRL